MNIQEKVIFIFFLFPDGIDLSVWLCWHPCSSGWFSFLGCYVCR